MAFVRIQSTLRGADPLGAYLVVIVAAVVALGARLLAKGRGMDKREKRQLMLLVILGVASLAVLYFTYSRSAYIGAAIAMFGAAWLSITNSQFKRRLLLAAAVLCVLFGGAVLVLRHDPAFENTVFHTSQLSKSPKSSNAAHVIALKKGLHDVIHEPFGRGPGTAGPASTHNNHPARIAENYFLQIGQEVGWLGLALFLAINVLIGKQLWDRRAEDDRLPMVLFVSLLGLSVVNMLLHAWADDTLAYIWWGMAGMATVGNIEISNRKKEKV